MKEETLLEQMTRVRPEVLDENALKLFNKIMEVIDERDELLEENKRLKEEYVLLQNASDEYEDELQERINRAIDLIEKSVTSDVGIDSNGNIIKYHQLTEDETGELLDILGGDVDDE